MPLKKLYDGPFLDGSGPRYGFHIYESASKTLKVVVYSMYDEPQPVYYVQPTDQFNEGTAWTAPWDGGTLRGLVDPQLGRDDPYETYPPFTYADAFLQYAEREYYRKGHQTK